jgi:hypothetical protein
VKKKDKDRRHLQIAAETGSAVRDVATLAGGMARHLLRRTRVLKRRAQTASAPAQPSMPPDTAVLLDGAPLPNGTAAAPGSGPDVAEWQMRARRAEQAAAWSRARLRVERAQRQAAPRLDVEKLSADLSRELARFYGAHPDVVQRIVRQTLAAHGLPISPERSPSAARAAPSIDTSIWSSAQQEALAQVVLTRSPEVADPGYVYRIVEALARGGRLTLPDLTRVTGLTSAMARHRLRLAAEALVFQGALKKCDDSYSLNPAYHPPVQPAASVPARSERPRSQRR